MLLISLNFKVLGAHLTIIIEKYNNHNSSECAKNNSSYNCVSFNVIIT
jgi:hypothetical protein